MSASISEQDKHCSSSVIEFKCNDHIALVNADVPSASYVAKLTGLSPFKKYNCTARVKNIVGASQSTEIKLFSTKQDGKRVSDCSH